MPSETAWRRLYKTEAWGTQERRCAYCHELLTLQNTTAEHTLARSKNGKTRKDNIKASCQPCNRLKGDMPEGVFLRMIKSPKHGDPFPIWLAWSRRRIALATARVCKKIENMVK